MKKSLLLSMGMPAAVLLIWATAHAEGIPDDYIGGTVETYDGTHLVVSRDDEDAAGPQKVTLRVDASKILTEDTDGLDKLSVGDDVVIGYADAPDGPILRSLVRVAAFAPERPVARVSVDAGHREALLSVFRDNWMRAAALSRQTVEEIRRAIVEAQDARGRSILAAADELEIAALRLEKGQEVSWRDIHNCYHKIKDHLR